MTHQVTHLNALAIHQFNYPYLLDDGMHFYVLKTIFLPRRDAVKKVYNSLSNPLDRAESIRVKFDFALSFYGRYREQFKHH